MLRRQVRGEAVVAGFHGRVGGEDGARGGFLDGLPGIQTIGLHAMPGPLENGEGGVAFVEMKHAGSDAQGAQGAGATHAQEQFLLDAHSLVPAVELRGQRLVLLAVRLVLRIEQDQADPPDLHFPHGGADIPARHLHADLHRLSRCVQRGHDGQVVDLVGLLHIVLPEARIQHLGRVALPVQ